MKVAFCIPNMIVGGVESVFIRTLDGILERIANDKKYKNIEICVITHAKITEPLYKNWFNKHPKIKIIVLYPLENYFEGLIKITEFFPLRQIRKISFSLYKKFKRLGIKRKIQDVDVFIDYKNCSFWKELRSINKRKIAWIHGNVAYLSNIGVDKYIDDYDKIIGLTDDFVTDFNEKFPNLKIHLHSINRSIVTIMKQKIKNRRIGFVIYNSDLNFVDVDYYIMTMNSFNDTIIDLLLKEKKETILYIHTDYYLSFIYDHYMGDRSTPYLQQVFKQLGLLTNYPEITYKIFIETNE